MSDMLDHALPFVVRKIEAYKKNNTLKPFFVGLNGVQGAGKTTLVTAIAGKLRSPPFSLRTAVISIDDFYLPHEEQRRLASDHPENPLVQHRGQPSTHDTKLWEDVFESLSHHKATKLPQYDKSRFNGQGDRISSDFWESVNTSPDNQVQIVIFEGWCVGFRALPELTVRELWATACKLRQEEASKYDGRLGWNRLEDIFLINEALRNYEKLYNYFDLLIHIDAEETRYVYGWRLEQEVALRKSRGVGMTDEQVRKFVDGYYPSYELYTEALRKGIFLDNHCSEEDLGRQLRIVVNKDRRVVEAIEV